MSFLKDFDETALNFVDQCVELQEILTNLDKMSTDKAVEKVSNLNLYTTEDGISTIIENIPCLLRIRPNYLSPLCDFCIKFVDKSQIGQPSAEFGRLLLEALLTTTSDDDYLTKVADYTLLRALSDEGLFSSRDYLPVLSKLYSENFYNQFVLMFLMLASNIEEENLQFYQSVFPILAEMVTNGFVDSELVPYVNSINTLKKKKWNAVKVCLNTEPEEKILNAFQEDNLAILKSVHFEPNMQLSFNIFEPCAILRHDPTLIQTAAFFRAFSCFKYLQQIGAKMHNKDSDGRSLGMFIAAGGDARIVEHIQRLNVSFKKTLPFAAMYRSYDMIEWVMEKRPKEVGDLKKELRNVLVSAAKYNNFRTFMSCLEMGQNPRNRDRHNINSLIASTQGRFYHFAQFVTLFDTVDLNGADSDGRTPLHYAAMNGDCDLIELFIDDGVNVLAKDKEGATPLHLAAGAGHVSAVEMLLGKVKDIDIQDKALRTPLHYACINDHGQAVQLLLQKGASFAIKDSSGKIPPQYCRDAEVLQLFKSK